jgi:hypothetical protein
MRDHVFNNIAKELFFLLSGAWRFYKTTRFISRAEKNHMNIAKIFDAYADKKPDKVCFYFEDEEWTYQQVIK